MLHAGMGRGVARLVGVLALLGGGCASTTTTYWTPGQIAAAENAINTAKAAGADQDAQAERHLRLAEEQLAAARERMSAGATRDAAWLLARAQADAELSQTLQQEAHTAGEAKLTEEQLEQARATSVPVSTPPVSTPSTGSSTEPAPSAPPATTPSTAPAKKPGAPNPPSDQPAP